MVKAIIDISDNANRILNVIKASYGLKDKSQAIDAMAKEYEDLVFEPRIKASYIAKLKKIEKERTTRVGTLKDFRKMYKMK
jgi:hypothetical protein